MPNKITTISEIEPTEFGSLMELGEERNMILWFQF